MQSAFDKTIGLKIFKLRNKRKDLIEQFVSSAKDSIISFIYDQVNSNTHLRDVIRQYASEAQPIIDSIKKLLVNHKGKFFRACRINRPENLNDYVQYEKTTRSPVETTPDTTVFYDTNMSKHETAGFLHSCNPPNQVEMDEDKWLNELKDRLVASSG